MTCILIIDDNPDIRALYTHFFRRMNCDVVEAPHPSDALEQLEQSNPFDMILVDFHLPRVNGLELLKRIREQYPDARVVMISAAPPPNLEAQARDAGAMACLFGVYDKTRLQNLFSAIS